MARRVKFELWNKELPNFKPKERLGGKTLQIGEGVNAKGTYSQHSGRSYTYITCPCCNAESKAYIWSFTGGGKRCFNCNVWMGWTGAALNEDEYRKYKKYEGKI